MRGPDPNRPMRRAIFLETGTNPYSWPNPTHEAGNLEVQMLSSSPMRSDVGQIWFDAVISHYRSLLDLTV